MIRSHLTVALRYVRKHKGYALINIVGLGIGMAACILILLYVHDELSYDTYHEHADRVYRVTQEQLDEHGGPGVHRVLIDPPVAPLLEEEFPEVVHAARFTPVGPLLSYGDRHIEAGDCYWTDPDVFDVFTLPLVAGNPQTALVDPFSLVLSTSKARALFGDEDPMGKTVLVNNEDAFTVTGVFEDVPPNTHLPLDVIGSMSTLESWFGPLGWDSPNYATYLLLAEGAPPDQLARQLPAFLQRHRGADVARSTRFHLQPLTDIHLRSHLVSELAPNGDIRYVYLLSAVALFILLIACINFMNLATARSARRAQEVGIRKVVGARRGMLIGQFLGESILTAFFSLALAVVIAELTLPFFNDFVGKDLGFQQDALVVYLALFVGIGLFIGIIAGSYPAFYLSAFRPIAVLTGSFQGERRGIGFRAALVVTQFVIAIVLLVGTFVVYQQLTFVRSQQLGFDKEHVLILPTVWDLREHFDPFREELLQHPDVLSVAQSNPVPSRRLTWSVEGQAQHEQTGQVATASLFPVFADAHFFPTYRIELVAGRNLSDEVASDADTGVILNATAVEQLGWSLPKDAVDAPLTLGGWRGTVIGVVKDFHLESLHQDIAPMVFYMDPPNYRMVSIRMRPGSDLPGVIDFLEAKWQQHEPNWPLSYSFLDERFEAVYRSEEKLGRTFGYFALLAVTITCLGLLGLAAFTVERRTKEIGIRKVLGASVPEIVGLLSKDVATLVLVAFLVAVPVAYVAMNRWLETFAYRVEVGAGTLALAGALALSIALVTVSYQAIKAARADPVKSLRSE